MYPFRTVTKASSWGILICGINDQAWGTRYAGSRIAVTKVGLKFLFSVEKILSSLATKVRTSTTSQILQITPQKMALFRYSRDQCSVLQNTILLTEQFLSSFESYQNSKSEANLNQPVGDGMSI